MNLKIRDLTDIAEIIGREKRRVLDQCDEPGPATKRLLSRYDELINGILAEEEYHRKLERKNYTTTTR